MSDTAITRRIRAPRPRVYRALLDPRAIEAWRVPDGMTCVMHELEARVGGRFRGSLTYDDPARAGKTTGATDTYQGRYVTLVPDERVVESIAFESHDPGLRGEMTVTTTLADAAGGETDVTMTFDGLPPAVSPADNALGTRMALDRLATLLEAHDR